jgi:molybdopterin/thiamine biosynthesis adenylyltransferase
VAEALARTGFEDVVLIDFDRVEKHNLDRLNYATREDIGKLKVEVLGRHLVGRGTAAPFHVDLVQASVYEEEGFRSALDCDLLFSCVDRPLGRYVLNLIAFAHLIPVIDGGISGGPTVTGCLQRQTGELTQLPSGVGVCNAWDNMIPV